MNTSKRFIAAAGTVLFGITLGSCTAQPVADAPATTSTTSTLIATGVVPAVANDLASNSAHHSLEVPGEQFALTVDYYLTDYNAAAWQTLQPKKVNLSAHLASTATAGDVPEVMIGSFSAVTTLLAAMPGLDGLPIAATDQDPNALPGYLINANYPYDNVVTIEGFSAELADRWAMVAGDQPLTEPALVAAGVYANRITFTFGVLVRNTGDTGYHQRILQDSLTVTNTVPNASPSSSAVVTPSG